jgi:hypothetical protein
VVLSRAIQHANDSTGAAQNGSDEHTEPQLHLLKNSVDNLSQDYRETQDCNSRIIESILHSPEIFSQRPFS